MEYEGPMGKVIFSTHEELDEFVRYNEISQDDWNLLKGFDGAFW